MKKYLTYELLDPADGDHPTATAVYLAGETDEVLRRQANAARSGMDAAKRISSVQLQQAHRLRAESSPEALESERQANAILTDRIAELERQLDGANKTIAHFLGPDGEKHIDRFAEAVKSLMESVTK
jgi:hypothetical protein